MALVGLVARPKTKTPSAFGKIHNILLIQGDGQDAQSVRDALANSSDRDFRVEWVKSCALGLERLAAPQIPIIVLCSMQDELVAKEAIQRGAQDYLLKEHLDSYLLPKTLAGVIERASITEALFDEKERAQVTLNSIGDAVISRHGCQ